VEAGRYVHLAVADTGTGMPAEVIAKAFEPFFTTKEVGKGTGLGLSMVYGFARQSGGHAAIDSTVGQGTTVNLYLPVVAAPSPPVTAPDAAPKSTRERAVLLVEDDDLVRESIEAKIARLGYRVTAVGSARDALTALETDAGYDLLFTDVIMPGTMTGVDLARAVMQRWPSIKVLATSGYTESNLLGKVQVPAGIALLAKPYSTTALAEALETAVGTAS
jgi:CheY-like chemotaxis protein